LSSIETTHVRDPKAPFRAYNYKEGREPYLFISYAHADSERVYPYIKRLHDDGFRIWYDEGIQYGCDWPKEVADALEGAAMMILFVSNISVTRPNVKDEVNFARDEEIPVMPLYLEKTTLPSEWRLRLRRFQAVRDMDAGYSALKKDLDQNTRNFVTPVLSIPDEKSKPPQLPPIGSIMTFGSYQWQVLDIKDESQALLITKDIITKQPYHKPGGSVTWENCSLRAYLNGEFYMQFDEDDREKIVETKNKNLSTVYVTADGKREVNTKGGNPTTDNVFLLSVEETKKYFHTTECETPAALEGLWPKTYPKSDDLIAEYGKERYWWWLRSPGFFQNSCRVCRL